MWAKALALSLEWIIVAFTTLVLSNQKLKSTLKTLPGFPRVRVAYIYIQRLVNDARMRGRKAF